MRAKVTVVVIMGSLLLAACGDADPGGGPDGADSSFDREQAEEQARDLLGRPADDVEEGPEIRIVRQGDEQFAGTTDLVPGRMNLELDDDGTGTFVVTKVVVEVPDGEEPLVVE